MDRFSLYIKTFLFSLFFFTPDLYVHAFTIGYIDLSNSAYTYPESYITGAGHTAIPITQITGADLSGIDVLWVLNPSNSDVSSDFTNNQAVINSFLAGGGNLIFHDRFVTDMAAILPGASGITFVRQTAAEIQIAAGAEALAAAMGVTDTSLDGGNYSSHGYALLSTLPVGSVVVLTQADPTQVVDMYYRYTGGTIYYSTIPLDHYLKSPSYIPGFSLYAAGLMDNLDSIFVVALPATAGTPNQRSILAHLQAQMPLASGAFLNDIVSLASVPSGEFAAALNQLSPEPYVGLRNAAQRVTRSGRTTVVERMQSLQLARTASVDLDQLYAAGTTVMSDAPDPMASKGKNGLSVWIKPYMNYAEQTGKNSYFGYTHDYVGLSAGADYRLMENALVGLYAGYADGTVDYSTVDAETQMKSMYAGIYSAAMFQNFFLHAQAAYMMHEFETRRELDFISRNARSSHDADEFSVSLGCEYQGFQAAGWNILPGLAFEYTYYDEEGFSENGAGSFNLKGDSVDLDSLTSRLGVRINKRFDVPGGSLVPEFQTAWQHEYGDGSHDITARFAGSAASSFTIKGVEPERDSVVTSLGINFVGDSMLVFVNCENEFAADYISWGVNTGIKYSF